jgi:hypothetical protein
MAGHHLIDAYLADLARHLPADPVDELADGLHETWQRHLASGMTPALAARAAIAEFGTPDQVTHAFVTQAPGRRTAMTLLASGPLVGACWGTALITAKAWTWPVPTPAAAVFAVLLLAAVAALAAAATSRRSYRRTRLGAAGGVGIVMLDTTMLTAVFFLAPAPVWPMFIAVPVSLARIGLTLRSLPTTLARR